MVQARCFVAVLAALSICAVHCVRTGDEPYETELDTGYFYVFGDQTIDIIDPVGLTVVNSITADQSGAPLTNAGSDGSPVNTSRTWNDGVFLEDPVRNLSYVFINEGDVYSRADGSQYSYVTVVDTNAQKVADRVQVGPLPVHLYAILQTLEVWSHSDMTGTFDTISIANPNALNSTVADFVDTSGHGKLLVDESIFPLAYATNVNEQVLEVINLQTQQRTASFVYNTTLPDPTICVGTHSIVYSTINKHVYAECSDNLGILEWDSLSNTLVQFFPNQTGYLSAAPADDKILVLDYDTPTVNVLQPNGNGQASTVLYDMEVVGNPDLDPVYWSNSTSADPEIANDYVIFFSLTADAVSANLLAASRVTVDSAPGSAQSPHYFAAPVDCTYSNATAAAEAYSDGNPDAGLTLAKDASGAAITPQCGACAAGIDPPDASAYNASASGLRYVQLSSASAAAAAGMTYTAPLIPAGAAMQTLNGDTGANDCSFGEVGRQAIRGGNWVAVVAEVPSPSVYIINPATQTVHGVVNTTADNPTTIVWAPTKNAGVTLDANAAGFAPYAGPGPAPAQASGPVTPSASSASAPAPAPSPTSAAGTAHALSYLALQAVAVVALLLSVVM